MKTNKTQKNIPQGWSSVRMRDVCDVNQGLQIPISERFNEPSKDRKVYITTQYLNGRSEAEYIENYSNSVVCSKEEILMTRTGNSGIVITGAEGIFHNNFFKVKPRRNISSKFLVYSLLSPHVQYKLLKLAGTSTIPDLNHGDFYSIEILLASLPEQKRIVKVLETWDKAIEKLGRKIEIKKNIKKGLMQNLLTGKVRLSGFSDEWKKAKLGELCEIKTGKKDNQDKVPDGKYPFFVRSPIIERINTYSYDGEAILIPGEGNVGKIFHYINGKFDYHQRVYKISDFKKGTLGKFIHYVLLKDFLKQTRQHSVKATVDSLRLPTFKLFELSIPNFEEQTAIANILTTTDNEIEALEKKKGIIEAQKKYLLNNLITGKIRTPESIK